MVRDEACESAQDRGFATTGFTDQAIGRAALDMKLYLPDDSGALAPFAEADGKVRDIHKWRVGGMCHEFSPTSVGSVSQLLSRSGTFSISTG